MRFVPPGSEAREGTRMPLGLDKLVAVRAAKGDVAVGSSLSMPGGVPPPRGLQVPPEKRDPRGNFRFFENRQKYLLFVHTCSEKRVIAERIGLELSSIHPRPPALRVFDAGIGDGTVLARVLRLMHASLDRPQSDVAAVSIFTIVCGFLEAARRSPAPLSVRDL